MIKTAKKLLQPNVGLVPLVSQSAVCVCVTQGYDEEHSSDDPGACLQADAAAARLQPGPMRHSRAPGPGP